MADDACGKFNEEKDQEEGERTEPGITDYLDGTSHELDYEPAYLYRRIGS